jgi:hypothetical protein
VAGAAWLTQAVPLGFVVGTFTHALSHAENGVEPAMQVL